MAKLPPLFTELEEALLLRAVNTERNLLARLYGYNNQYGEHASFYFEGIIFKDDGTWQKQIDALNSAEKKLIGEE